MGFFRVLCGSRLITLFVVFSRGTMRLGSFIVVLGRFVVCCLGHYHPLDASPSTGRQQNG